MNLADQFLLTAYLKSRKEPTKGFLVDQISRLLNLDKGSTNEITYLLTETGFLRGSAHTDQYLMVTGAGFEKAQSYFLKETVYVLQFLKANYFPLVNKGKNGFTFHYNLTRPNISEVNHSITVLISDVASTSLGNSFVSGQGSEKLLMQFARDHLSSKLITGALKHHEEVELSDEDRSTLNKFDISALPEVSGAEFLVEVPKNEAAQQPLIDETVNSEPAPQRETFGKVPYLNLPKLPLTPVQADWLNIIYKEFNTNMDVADYTDLIESWEPPFSNFDPTKISSLLLVGGRQITLYGIYHVDSASEIFELFDKTIYAIRELLPSNGNLQSIESTQLVSKIPGMTMSYISQIFKLMQTLPGFAMGSGRKTDGTYTLNLNALEVKNTYRSYPGLQAFMDTYLSPMLEMSTTDSIKNPDPPTNPDQPAADILSWSPTRVVMKARESFAPVMGVGSLAVDMAGIIESLPVDKGQMIGIFGRWGRGKTFFINVLKGRLKENNTLSKPQLEETGKLQYKIVEFHAWKFQETPASWAYLYESFVKEYLGPKKGWLWFWHWAKLFYLNFRRSWFGSICWLLISAGIITGVSYISYYYILDENSNAVFWGIFSLSTILSLGFLKEVNRYSTKAVHFIKKYTTKNIFKASLGIQADIQEELVKLLKIWISPKKLNKKKIILIVEDIDRCNEDKIIPNIDALRVMLEEDEISKRLLIITAIDERILRNAITLKYRVLNNSQAPAPQGKNALDKQKEQNRHMQELVTEYMDKLFVCAIKLGALTPSQKGEYLHELFKNDRDEQPDRGAQPLSNDQILPAALAAVNPPTNIFPPVTPSFPGVQVSTTGPATAPVQVTGSKAPGWSKLNSTETQLITEIVNAWPEATPRKISIFYYRYLLCKNILIGRYSLINQPNPWRNGADVGAVLELLMHFGNCHEPARIYVESGKLTTLDGKKPQLPGLDACSLKPLSDYLQLLEVMELIIAY